ncbi:uncharacterized protein LOC120338219 isoform X1 [Styela clava]
MKKESLTLLVLLFLKFSTAITDCSYKGDMCKVDVEDCLKKKLYDGDMTDCTGLSYQDLFISRGDVEFWIDIYERGNYARNLTYTIISEIGESWQSVKDCCQMTPTSTCILPKGKKSEVFFIYLPMKRAGQYCELQLFEYQKELKWCSETDRTPCKELVRGIISIKGIYHPLSTDNFHPSVDFCFFRAPADFVQIGNGSHSEFSRDVKGMKHDENQNSVLVGKTLRRCDLLENIIAKNITEHISSRYKRNAEETVCFFTRLKGYDNKWSSNPICQIPCNNGFYENENNDSDRYISVLTRGRIIGTLEEKVELISKHNKTTVEVNKLHDETKYSVISVQLESDDVTWDQQDPGFETGIPDTHCISFEKHPEVLENNRNNDSGFSESSKRSSANSEIVSLTRSSCSANDEIDISFLTAKNEIGCDIINYALPEVENYTMSGDYMKKSSFLTISDAKIKNAGSNLCSHQKRKTSSSSGCISLDYDNCSLESSIEEAADVETPGFYVRK